ncbi:MAG TPA: hypothetical protein VHA79_00070 [Mycobacteriales bacterium]|nr:hypothetical protein [Mycobacteriales bacterium]HVX68071.1 hypothetical protein [Mycobacteriales bacterium]
MREIAPPLAGIGALAIVAAVLPGQLSWKTSSQHHKLSALHSIRIEWPSRGQAAIAIPGLGRKASPGQMPVPIASVAKVMTAYIVLRTDPLTAGNDGFTMTFDDTDVARANAAHADGQSYVPVAAGEVITEREALAALLLPSANNIAIALAEHRYGSVPGFVAQMNRVAHELGMQHTTYTDPSGYDPSTISTASDQLRLARAAMEVPAFAELVGMREAVLPYVGPVRNTDTLLGHAGFVGIKTGSDQAAGGCFMYESVRRVNGHRWRIFGVVLGQSGGPLIQAALKAALTMVNDLTDQLPTIAE